jgi:HEAT repeat protein
MNSMLLVNKDRLIQLLEHQDKRVRDQSAIALGAFFPYSTGIIAPLIRAINKNKNDSLSLAARIKKFTPSNGEFAELIKLFNETNPNNDEHSINISWHIQESLLSFPIEVLTNNRNTIKFNKILAQHYDIAINQEKIKSQKPDDLWNSLRDLCKQHKDKDFDRESSQYAQLYNQGLLRHKEHVKHKVVMYLSKETNVDYLFENYLVQLSGNLKIEESVPYLFKLLNNTDFMYIVHDTCMQALGEIGGIQVVDYIYNDWSNEKLRSEYTDILGSIPLDYSEELLIQCLNHETDTRVKTFLCSALCNIFSMKGIELILNVIKKQEYDPQIISLFDHLLPVCVYHGITLDNAEMIVKEQDKFTKATWEKSPLYEVSRKLKHCFDQILFEQDKNISIKEDISLENNDSPINLGESINHEKNENKIAQKNKIGRNTPCPCGSGKKYKKCCLKKEHA